MKMRSDLTCDTITYQGVEYWVVKEPLGQKYYQFPPHVFHILKQLDGTKSIDDLIDNFHEENAPKRITRSELQQLLTRFHKDGLVISEVNGQGIELLRRGRKNLIMERVQACSNILAVRYRGFDPERILNWLIRGTWWLFTPAAVIFWLALGLVALLSVMVNFAEFQARMPGFEQFFDINKWYMFVGVMAVTKVLHEFGHGLACKRLGGECHEIGFMLLVLTPCLYCNVSDSWRLPNKWHRAAIGAAGMYVELILATIATFVWWFVQPGAIQDICLQIMLVCSVSTLLFNGNPLLRFDGYYILSDILEIPNLYQKSTKALTTLLGRHWLGLEIPDDQLMPTNRPWAFASYTIAAFLYRWFILFSIIWFLMIWLEPYGLESLGKGIAIFAMFGMLFWPLFKLYRYMSVPGRMNQIEKPRFAIGVAIIVAVLSSVLLIPIPHYLRCSLIVVPDQLETVYVQEQGMLSDCEVGNGDLVQEGDILATLQNLDLEMAYQEAAGKLAYKTGERKGLVLNGSVTRDSTYLEQLSTIDSEIRQLSQMVNDLQHRMGQLEIKSPITGTVLATPYQHPSNGNHDLEIIDQQPFLTERNNNVYAIRGQRFCEVANLTSWYAIVLLDEQQINFANEKLLTKIKLYSRPNHVIESKVESLGVADQSLLRQKKNNFDPAELPKSRLPDLVTEMVAAHQHGKIQYFARVPIDADGTPLKIGLSGQARIFTGYRSLGSRLWWWISHNFLS